MDGNGAGVGPAEKEYKNTFIHMSIERDLINFNLYRMCGMCEYVYVRCYFETPNNKAEERRAEEKGGSVSCVTITLVCELAFCAVELVRQRNLVNANTFYKMLCVYCYIVRAFEML